MKKVNILKIMLYVGMFIMIASTVFINEYSNQSEIDQLTYIQGLGLCLVLPYIFHHE